MKQGMYMYVYTYVNTVADCANIYCAMRSYLGCEFVLLPHWPLLTGWSSQAVVVAIVSATTIDVIKLLWFRRLLACTHACAPGAHLACSI